MVYPERVYRLPAAEFRQVAGIKMIREVVKQELVK
jgi:hypothetical protein